jgi:hypothetical protein
MTGRQLWLLVHIGLGAGFIHGFLGGSKALVDWRDIPDLDRRRVRSTIVMAAASWTTVVTGTWLVYVWYRAEPPGDASTLAFPKAWLLEHSNVSFWHEFGMEWKEHIGWLAPILATAVAVMAIRHRSVLRTDWRARRLVAGLFAVAFATALIAASLGAVINKVAPNQFLESLCPVAAGKCPSAPTRS